MKKVSIFVFLLATTLTVIRPVHGQDALTFNFSDPSRPGLLKLTLFNGSIEVKTHPGRDVIIESHGSSITRRRPAPPASDGLRRIDSNTNGLSVEEENNVLTVSNRNAGGGGNLEIQVPVRTNLNLKTYNGGRILVDGVDGEMELENANGRVELINVAGSVVAHSMNGRVVASFREIMSNKPMSFVSMNGDVDITLPPAAKANLKMRADHGGTYSDFEIQLRPTTTTVDDNRKQGGRLHLETERMMNGTINGGGSDIDLRTFNGNIYIRKAK